MCICGGVGPHVCRCPQRSKKGVISVGAGGTGVCELYNASVGI